MKITLKKFCYKASWTWSFALKNRTVCSELYNSKKIRMATLTIEGVIGYIYYKQSFINFKPYLNTTRLNRVLISMTVSTNLQACILQGV